MSILTNSNRSVLKATYVPLKAPVTDVPADLNSSGSAMNKTSFARNLRLQTGEINRVRRTLVSAGSQDVSETVWQALVQFEPQPLPILTPKVSTLANIASDQLLAAGRAILASRTQELKTAMGHNVLEPSGAGSEPLPAGDKMPVSNARTVAGFPAPSARAAAVISPVTPVTIQPAIAAPTRNAASAGSTPMEIQHLNPAGFAASAVTSAAGAINAFENAVQATPVGMLHLERIEMSPAGIERGELLSTIPLAPGETTSVEQKEWTVTSQEFSSIVTDSLENYSEKGVTEKTELAESTESQTKHSQQLGLNASVSGSYGFVTFSANASFNSSSSDDESKKASRDHATEVTQKASSRVRKEHKVTIQTSSVTGTAETSTRTLTNPSSTDTMRIDYFSLMRKWRVRLLRYGLRMTYDIAIPEPGATLRALHAQLADLNEKLSSPFTFTLEPAAITVGNYPQLMATSGIALEPPPQTQPQQTQTKGLVNSTGSAQGDSLPFDIKDGYEIESVSVGGYGIGKALDNSYAFAFIHFLLDDVEISNSLAADDRQGTEFSTAVLSSFAGQSGHLNIQFYHRFVWWGSAFATVSVKPMDATIQAWQQRVWQALYNAARDTFYTQQQLLAQQRDALKAELENVDTLTLRREEREEIMKGVLRWLLGPEFDFMPKDVQKLFVKMTNGKMTVADWVEQMGEWFANDDTHMTPSDWSVMYNYGEMVKFVMEAIEWENLLYVLYPYFWDIPLAWDFIRRLQHRDSTREAFLRAGSARVVLTLRPGWEDDFLAFLENGEFGKLNHPYMTISDEMRAYANTNYPGIPPANPESSVRPLLTSSQRKAWQDMQGLMAMLNKYYNDNKQNYPTTAQGLAALAKYGTIPSADPWGKPYQYICPGKFNDYDLYSLGADGKVGGEAEDADITSWATASLIGEWYEYTPSHGLDIGITTTLANMQ